MHGNGVPPNQQVVSSSELTRLFMGLFLAALSVLFLSSVALYIFFRVQTPTWPPEGTPPMPGSLWLGLLILLGGSLCMHLALVSAARGEAKACAGWVLGTLALAICFLVFQVASWQSLLAAGLSVKSRFGGLLFIFVVLHWVHVLGGLFALVVTYLRARAGVFKPGALSALRSAVSYWHFLDVVWLALLLLLWGTGWRS